MCSSCSEAVPPVGTPYDGVPELRTTVFLDSEQDAVVIGGLDMQAQAKALAARPHIVVATPGRLRVSLLLF